MSDEDAIRRLLTRVPDDQIERIYAAAKDRKKGLRPFFADPRAMIALREERARRTGKNN